MHHHCLEAGIADRSRPGEMPSHPQQAERSAETECAGAYSKSVPHLEPATATLSIQHVKAHRAIELVQPCLIQDGFGFEVFD